MNNKLNSEQLLQFLQGCHSILGIAWPKPGIPEMAEARIYIGTKVFLALKDAIQHAEGEFEVLRHLQNMQMPFRAWQMLTKIVTQLEWLGPKCQSSSIDPAFNLIYLTTGILYHHISTTFSVIPKRVARFSTVETLDKLLKDCLWEQPNKNNTTELLENLVDNLQECLEKLEFTVKTQVMRNG